MTRQVRINSDQLDVRLSVATKRTLEKLSDVQGLIQKQAPASMLLKYRASR